MAAGKGLGAGGRGGEQDEQIAMFKQLLALRCAPDTQIRATSL